MTHLPMAGVRVIEAALAVSIAATRIGLAWGDWMRRIRR